MAGDRPRTAQARLDAGRRARAAGALATAEAMLRRARQVVPDDVTLTLPIDDAMTDLFALAGQVDRAFELGDRLLARLDVASRLPSGGAELHLRLARAAVAAGRWQVAADHLAAARRIPRAGRGEAVVPAALRALGVTSREADVLALLADGLTNRELAEQLHLSPRTATGEVFSALMVAEPGTRFEYGTSTDWLGRVVEAASGRSLDRYLADRIFGPLGMRSTGFLLDDVQRAVCVPVHVNRLRASHKVPELGFDWQMAGHRVTGTFNPVGPFDRASCIRRHVLDRALLDAASAAASRTSSAARWPNARRGT